MKKSGLIAKSHAVRSPFAKIALLSFLLISGSVAPLGSTKEKVGIEKPSTLRASQILPESLRYGENFKVQEKVENDGIWNIYTLQTGNTDHHFRGTYLLSERIHELHALAELRRVNELVLVGKGAVNSLVGTGEDLVKFGTHPVATVDGMGKGFSRIMNKAQESLGSLKKQEKADDSQPSKSLLRQSLKMGKDLSGVTENERTWYEKVGVDPYTPNREIHEEIQRLALIEASGQIAEKALIPIPRPIGLAASLSSLAWSEDSDQLINRNISKLEGSGIDQATIKRFLENPYYTLSGKTSLVYALDSLQEVPGKDHFLLHASHADNYELATFFLLGGYLLHQYHTELEPFIEIVPNTVTPAGLLKDKRIAVFYPADYLFWTEEVSHNLRETDREIRKRYGDISIMVRITGSASEKALKGFSQLEWDVTEEIFPYQTLAKQPVSGD